MSEFTKGDLSVDTFDYGVVVGNDKVDLACFNMGRNSDINKDVANAHLFAAANKMYAFIAGLQLSSADDVEREELLKQARGES